ncbi:hypothetical protein [Methylobacterium sp. ap11]|uniref:hypothetical protein n=1 Tax=Methylobacterium sp. ap11 TaxID=1761799 RepID=UPI0011608D2B|nr:hypothetical protein [Methylobacterium sp. ap11]
MPIELKDIVGWGVTGGLGLVSLWLNIQTRRDAKRTSRKQKERIWSLHQEDTVVPEAEGVLLRIHLEEPNMNRFRLISIKVQLPKRALVSEFENVFGHDGRYIGAKPIYWKNMIEPNIELKQDRRYAVDRATHLFFVKPASIKRLRNPTDRVRISIKLEEVSSSRSITRLNVTSEPIAWPSIQTTSVT